MIGNAGNIRKEEGKRTGYEGGETTGTKCKEVKGMYSAEKLIVY